ncbi:uncharacterized protein SPAPADRAFT_134277 [Spathaspora passalidarum NRRL Y-27907]|uniref:NDT80 domain-containing protein n=1 Tax=Spathaspora passalidarum (strain NRRL Y-27907 / 11-Y1) TaxID=619300 RepID=G3AHT0_SPAPN|nr:uncharacterized protein SPAPADRAFT_134277 [Spathaspora passalidarum NRRL Y-27907]EGW34244.1 hypothetical protein SPAPADRAFT_134277 [Spathaspora passalidarum NRRL Y-27907]
MSLQFKSSPLRKRGRSKRYLSEGKSDPISHSKSHNKIAPRSGLQFKVGPPFGETIQISPIFSTIGNQNMIPVLSARIDRGFDLVDNEWIGYKRNYFSVVATFQFRNHNKTLFEKSGFYTQVENNSRDIKSFAIRLVSKCLEDESDVPLVQHTAKRDRGPQIEPPIVPIIPGILPSHIVIKESANIRKAARVVHFDRLFYDDRSTTKPYNRKSILHSYPPGNLTKVAKYERIQFASSVQHRKPVSGTKNFILQIQLLSELGENTYAVVALCETPPLTVRGRSPSNYTPTNISPNQIENRTSQFVSPVPIVSFGSYEENYEVRFDFSNNQDHIDNFEYDSFEPNNKDMFLNESNPNEVLFQPYDEPVYIPPSLSPSYFLEMTAKFSSEEEEESTQSPPESFLEDFQNNFNQPYTSYFKTYLDDLDEENPTISPSLLFTISE